MTRTVPASTTDHPVASMPIFASLYCALSWSANEGSAGFWAMTEIPQRSCNRNIADVLSAESRLNFMMEFSFRLRSGLDPVTNGLEFGRDWHFYRAGSGSVVWDYIGLKLV